MRNLIVGLVLGIAGGFVLGWLSSGWWEEHQVANDPAIKNHMARMQTRRAIDDLIEEVEGGDYE